MKHFLSFLAIPLLFGACEQKIETPAQSGPAEKTVEKNTTVVQPTVEKEKTTTTTESPGH